MKRWIRILLAFFCFAVLTFFFLDFVGVMPPSWNYLVLCQFIPAYKSLNYVILGAILLITLLFGRIYCSTLCPLGVLQDIIAWISRRFKRGGKTKKYDYHSEKTWWRYPIMILFILLGSVGVHIVVSLLDPYSIFGRIAVNLLGPIYITGNNILAAFITSRLRYGNFYFEPVAIESLSTFWSTILWTIIVFCMAWRYGRLYCNAICPVGAILGLFSRFSFWKIRIDQSKCTKCGLCAAKCKSSCIDSKSQKVDSSRCVDCFDCLSACRKDAISWSLPLVSPTVETNKTEQAVPSEEPKSESAAQLNKREFLTVLATGVAAAVPTAVLEAVEETAKDAASAGTKEISMPSIAGTIPFKREYPITPPGSENQKDFSKQCTACHLCVNRCPANVLKPAFLEYGLTGLLQPRVEFSRGFCNFDCTICSEVCPNNALKTLTQDQKHKIQMGKVHLIKENCIVFTEGTSCGACSEHCPTQAVAMVEQKDGKPPIPVINPDICVGCGGCEFICPARPYRAIYVEGNPVHLEAKPIVEAKKVEVKLDEFGF